MIRCLWIALAAMALALAGCHDHADHGHEAAHGHGHEAAHGHGDDHGHGHGDDHGDDHAKSPDDDHAKSHGDEHGHGHGEGTAYTTYAAHTELFVEVPTLVLDEPVSLAAQSRRGSSLPSGPKRTMATPSAWSMARRLR